MMRPAVTIHQAERLEPVPYSYMCVLVTQGVQLFATPLTVARQAPLSMGFSRQEYGVVCHSLLQGIFPTQ